MIDLSKQEEFKVCQVDTCVISDVLESKPLWDIFEKFIVDTNSVIGLSAYTFYELQKRNEIYIKFLLQFPPKRIAILKPFEDLLKEEIANYPNNKKTEPIWVPPTENFNLINSVFGGEKMKIHYSFLDGQKAIVLESLVALVKEYPSPNNDGKFYKKDWIEFVRRVTNQQFERFDTDWYNNRTDGDLKFEVFKSLTSQLYITFFKFYLLKERKPKLSDPMDISISASFPYVDFVLTEKNLVHDARRIQKEKLQFDDVEVYTLEDIRKR